MRPLITLTLLLTTLSHDAHAQMEVLAVHGDVRIKNNAVDPMQLVRKHPAKYVKDFSVAADLRFC